MLLSSASSHQWLCHCHWKHERSLTRSDYSKIWNLHCPTAFLQYELTPQFLTQCEKWNIPCWHSCLCPLGLGCLHCWEAISLNWSPRDTFTAECFFCCDNDHATSKCFSEFLSCSMMKSVPSLLVCASWQTGGKQMSETSWQRELAHKKMIDGTWHFWTGFKTG